MEPILPAAAVSTGAGCGVTHLAVITQCEGPESGAAMRTDVIFGVCKLNTASKRCLRQRSESEREKEKHTSAEMTHVGFSIFFFFFPVSR